MSEALKLTQTLGSKIFHDLSGSIGTIDNCLGLLDSDNKIIREQAKNLLLQESNNLVKRIKFFRSSYGLVEDQLSVSIIDMIDMLNNFFEDSKIKFTGHIVGGLVSLDAHMAKVAYCLVAIAAENIAFEGSIDLYVNEENDSLFKIVSNGRDFQLRPECFSILNGEIISLLTITNCREHYASNICSEHGYKLSINKNVGSTEYFVIKR